MPLLSYSEDTLDDLLRTSFDGILKYGDRIEPNKGAALELRGIVLELRNPRARLSRTETRGKAFSCLGELCWYLAASDEVRFISHYIPAYEELAIDGIVYGAYGPRLLNWDGVNQLDNVIRRLQANPHSRRAVIQLFSAHDLPAENDIPCTCALQLLLRDENLHMLVMMRSNDAVLGTPHDIFCFTMIQEIISRALSVEPGWYRHVVGSLHVYEKHLQKVDAFLSEGWQSKMAMPFMPPGDQRSSVQGFLRLEEKIRMGELLSENEVTTLDPYWADLVRLLQVHASAKAQDRSAIEALRDQMANDSYHSFIDGRRPNIE